jgi:hypothetical protein
VLINFGVRRRAQATDPVAADAFWARLDRQLTNGAIWVPTVIPNEADLISHRRPPGVEWSGRGAAEGLSSAG